MSTVIIACKLPAGITMGLEGKSIKINGSNDKENFVRYEGGELVGITYNVPKDLWDAWRKKFADHPLVCGSYPYNEPFLFESQSEKSVRDRAKETKEVKTGLEPKTKEELSKVAGATENKEVD